MKQHILLTIISLLVFSAPAAAMASPVDPSAPLAESTEMQGINDEANHVDVSVSGTNIRARCQLSRSHPEGVRHCGKTEICSTH